MQMSSKIANRVLSLALVLVLVGSILSIASNPISRPSYASHENITIEISDDVTDTYEPGDSVTIEGTIDDLVDDEVVTIDINKPSGTTTHTEDDIEPNSSGDFDFSYETPTSADEGVWTVEVQYDGESAFTYFIVDDESDTIDIELDETSATYEAGSDVEISGQVDEVETGEDVVEITVIDPTDDEIVDSEEAELGDGTLDEDEFEFTVELPSDAEHGRYAVKISYGDDQEGFILFEVEDDGGSSSGSDAITAESDESAYQPGDTVEISGQIEDVQSSTELEIVVEDPDGEEIESDNDVTVESDGDFSFDFDLEDDAPEGEYTVTLTYGDEELEINFDVDEDAGSGSGSSNLTVRLSKSSLLAGESFTVSGTVPKIVTDEEVSILVYDKNSVFVGPAAYVEPKSDKTFSETLRLKPDLEVEDDYTVRVNYNGEEVRAEFSITGQSSGSDAITIKTDDTEYPAGSTVMISGKVSSDLLVEDEKMLIQIFNPEDTAYRFDQVDVEDDGSYSYEVVVGGKLGIGGVYEVKAVYGGIESKTTFTIEGGKAMYDLRAAGKTFKIQYDITDGSIRSMFVDEDAKKLVVVLDDVNADGQLTLVLPREVINSAEGDEDIPYVIRSTDLEAGAGSEPDVDESDATGSTRTVVIDYEQGTDLIEISGTSVVPEFGSIAALILAVAVLAITLVTGRSRFIGNTKFGSNFLK